MKPLSSKSLFSHWAAITTMTLGSITLLFATPQTAPSGDAEVTEFLQMEVDHDPQLEGSRIQIEIRDGIATLTGEADSMAQAERASARAIASVGVRAVVNQVKIAPQPKFVILNGAKSALSGQKMVNSGRIRVSVTGQRAVMEGNVPTADEKELAREILFGVPGVAAVENHLTVSGNGGRDDSQIAEHLRFLIRRDPLCEGLDLTVTVNSGSAKISGEVGTSQEVGRLLRRCRVEGVSTFRTTELKVNSDLAMEGIAEKEYSKVESVAALREAIAQDSRINARSITIAMNDGVVLLTGKIRSQAEGDAAEFTARSIPGVQRVVSHLGIQNRPEVAGDPPDIRAASSRPTPRGR